MKRTENYAVKFRKLSEVTFDKLISCRNIDRKPHRNAVFHPVCVFDLDRTDRWLLNCGADLKAGLLQGVRN